MKKVSVIMIIILCAVIFTIAIGIIPFAMTVNSIDKAVNSRTDAYNFAFSEIVNNSALSDDIKRDASFMYGSMNIYIENILKSEFGIVIYLLAVISIILILFGVYFIKNKGCKNYIGAIFIVAACILLAFTTIFCFQLFSINLTLVG